MEGFIGGSKDCVDPFPVERLCQPCRLDGGHQHAVDTQTENVTCLGGPSLSHTYLSTAGRWSPEHWDSPCHPVQKKGAIPVCLFSPECLAQLNGQESEARAGRGRERPAAWLPRRPAETLGPGDVLLGRVSQALAQAAELRDRTHSMSWHLVVNEVVRNGETGHKTAQEA